MGRRTKKGFQPNAFQEDAFQMPDANVGTGSVPWFWYAMPRQKAIRERERKRDEEKKKREQEEADAMRMPLVALRYAPAPFPVPPPPAITTLAKLRTSTEYEDAKALDAFMAFLQKVAESEELV